MKYSYDFFFNEKEKIFYLEDKMTKFEELYNKYKNSPNTKIHDGIYEIRVGKYIYPLMSPENVIFIFPNGTQKSIFISSYFHLNKILKIYNSYDFFYCKDESGNYLQFNSTNIVNIYPVKKVKIEIKQHKELYNLNNKFIEDYSRLNPDNYP